MSGQTTQSLKISVILHTVMQRLGYNQGQNIRLHTANPNPVDFARFPPRKTAMKSPEQSCDLIGQTTTPPTTCNADPDRSRLRASRC
jgi:hypothetical protein